VNRRHRFHHPSSDSQVIASRHQLPARAADSKCGEARRHPPAQLEPDGDEHAAGASYRARLRARIRHIDKRQSEQAPIQFAARLRITSSTVPPPPVWPSCAT